MRRILSVVAVVLVLAVAVYGLRSKGRLWWCECGYLLLWSGDAWSSDNSQHISDPYSFTHVLHGFVIGGLVTLILPSLSAVWRLWIVVSVESVWEVVENSAFVIDRYRAGTAALGYTGDTVVNSLADIVLCGIGFMLARLLGLRLSIVVFVVTEVMLAAWIRDNLTLNVVMLIHPLDSIKEWQAAGH